MEDTTQITRFYLRLSADVYLEVHEAARSGDVEVSTVLEKAWKHFPDHHKQPEQEKKYPRPDPGGLKLVTVEFPTTTVREIQGVARKYGVDSSTLLEWAWRGDIPLPQEEEKKEKKEKKETKKVKKKKAKKKSNKANKEEEEKGRRQSIYFSEDMLKEILEEATEQDKSLSDIIQRAWEIAREEIQKYPSVR